LRRICQEIRLNAQKIGCGGKSALILIIRLEEDSIQRYGDLETKFKQIIGVVQVINYKKWMEHYEKCL